MPCLAALLAAFALAPGETVATLDVLAPEAESFVLHATIPLPRGVLEPGAEEVPFAVRSHDRAGTLVPAQVEGVSRYATGEWDVVQVLARVERGADEEAGQPLRYEVVRESSSRAAPHPPGALLAGLLARKRGLVLRCRDVYGHTYALDLLAKPGEDSGSAWTLRKGGSFLNQFRTAGVLMPQEDEYTARRAGPPLAHMMGALAWFSDWQGEEVLQLDLRVHNGLAGGARGFAPGEEPAGAVYWQSLELCVPAGLTLVPNLADPFFGEPYREKAWRVYPIVAPYDEGELHMMPPQAQLVRRLALVRDGEEDLARARLDHEGLGFCAYDLERYSWANPRTARYFAQRDALPSMDSYRWGQARGRAALRAHEARRLTDLREQMELGAGGLYPSKSPALGWAHPWFIPIEGGTGGEEIALLEGVRAVGGASRESYSRLELVHRRNVDRQPHALWNRAGEPLGVDAWRVEARRKEPSKSEASEDDGAPIYRIPFKFQTNGRGVLPIFKLPALGGPKASEQVREVARRGARPPYDGGTVWKRDGELPRGDGNLVTWLPHDGQHWVRFTKNAKALLWLGDDALAEDDLALCAELFRLYFHEYASPYGPGARVTLAHFEDLAEAFPASGLPLSRDHAWGLDAFCAYYSTAPDAWRERHRPWAARVADLMVSGAMPSGILIRSNYPPLLGNPRYEGAHAFQSEFLMLAQRSLIESVFRGVDGERAARLRALYLRASEYLFWGPVWQRVRASWSPDHAPVFETGPRWAFPVARNDGRELPPFSDVAYWGQGYLPQDGFKGDVETSYGYAILSFAADWTSATDGRGPRNRYIKRLLDLGRGAESFPALLEALTGRAAQPDFDRTRDVSGFVARLQRWLGRRR